jgi:hypothetical protein
VEGDLDHDMLSKLAAVPSVIGELALSVESLVSDDVTVGGFESDVLAKIAANTLNARKRPSADADAAAVTAVSPSIPSSNSTPVKTAEEVSTSTTTTAEPGPTMPKVVSTGSVPNPLLDHSYDPVPNPLARITPPASPTPSAGESNNNKRKESSTSFEADAEYHHAAKRSSFASQ